MATYNETATGGCILAGLAFLQKVNRNFVASGGCELGGSLNAPRLHPLIEFQVNLFPPSISMAVGPKTNSRTTNMIDLAGTPSQASAYSQRTIQIPGVAGHLKHGDVFELNGQLALRVKRSYSSGTVDDAFSTPLIITSITLGNSL